MLVRIQPRDLNNRGNYYETLNIDEVNFMINEIRELLTKARNPVIINQLQSDLRSWLTIKRLIEQNAMDNSK